MKNFEICHEKFKIFRFMKFEMKNLKFSFLKFEMEIFV
jgi:hypothetical protein